MGLMSFAQISHVSPTDATSLNSWRALHQKVSPTPKFSIYSELPINFLAHADDVPLLARGFEIKFLDCAGYGPELSRCVHCGSDVQGTAANRFGIAFSIRYGGVLCVDCKNRDGAAFTITPGSCELLKMLRKSEWERFNRIRASTRNHQELKRGLGSFIEYHTERSLKSLRFIENVL